MKANDTRAKGMLVKQKAGEYIQELEAENDRLQSQYNSMIDELTNNELTQNSIINTLRRQRAQLEEQLAELRKAARELTLPVRFVCCQCSHSTMWMPDTPEALLQEKGE